jgi:antitoxin component YwqK of YwqJK toxin-antitoxin module
MKKLSLLAIFFLVSCGISIEEKEAIAINACSIMGETKKNDSLFRIQTMIDAREEIGGETFVGGDDKILEAFEWGLCKELVLNENYAESLQFLKDFEREKQRIADSKPTTKETFHSNGQLHQRINYQPKSDGGLVDGLYEKYYDSGVLEVKANYKDGKLDGYYEDYYDGGEIRIKANYKDGKFDGPYEKYCKVGKLVYKSNYKNGELDGIEERYISCLNNDEVIRTSYKNGVKDGLYEHICWLGRLEYSVNYKNGVKQGPFEQYYGSDCKGQLQFKGNYVDGKIQDGWQSLTEDGRNITHRCALNEEKTRLSSC